MVILQKHVTGLSQTALERFVVRARRAAGLKAGVDVLVTGSSELRSLNHHFRSVNKATDVLSFPAATPSNARRSASRETKSRRAGFRQPRQLAGEIAVSAEIAAQNAIELGHSPAKEVKILVLHGILHLAGFDHERDNGEMAEKELRLRRALRLPAGLIERTNSPRGTHGKAVTRAVRGAGAAS